MPSKPLSCNQYVARGIRKFGLKDMSQSMEMAVELSTPVPQVAPHRSRRATAAKMTLPPVAPAKSDATVASTPADK